MPGRKKEPETGTRPDDRQIGGIGEVEMWPPACAASQLQSFGLKESLEPGSLREMSFGWTVNNHIFHLGQNAIRPFIILSDYPPGGKSAKRLLLNINTLMLQLKNLL